MMYLHQVASVAVYSGTHSSSLAALGFGITQFLNAVFTVRFLKLVTDLHFGLVLNNRRTWPIIITNLNLASQLKEGWQSLEKKPVVLAPLLRAVAVDAMNSSQSEQHTITVNIDEGAANAQIMGDAFLLRRALQNLLDNSIRHNETGCQIRLSLHCNDRKIILAVEDDGVGLPNEISAWLQGKFDTGNKKHGIGLSIVAQVMQVHEGSICCDNHSPKGCTIELCWPLM
jgi:signal transduction histidine kinase